MGEAPVLAQPWWERTTLTKIYTKPIQSLPNQLAIYCIYDYLVRDKIATIILTWPGEGFARVCYRGANLARAP